MRAKEFFQLVRMAPDEIRRIKARQQAYIELATNITSAAGEMTGNTGELHSKVEKAALGLLELAQRLGDQAEQLVGMMTEAEQVIACLRIPRHRQVLSMRYVERKRWEDITVEMGYTDPRAARYMHGRALQAAERAMLRS